MLKFVNGKNQLVCTPNIEVSSLIQFRKGIEKIEKSNEISLIYKELEKTPEKDKNK